MEILKRCACGAILINNASGWREWRKNDPVIIKIAMEKRPEGCLVEGINYIPMVLACEVCGELPVNSASNFSGF